MAKEKKEELSTEKKKLSYETELALVGLMIAIVSLIGLLNQGYFGSIITFALVFVFGSWYYLVLIGLIYLGFYLLIKRKRPKSMTTLTTISFVLLLVSLALASSRYDGATLGNFFTYYKAGFNRASGGTYHIDITKINQVGGGIIGYSVYALLVTLLGKVVTSIVIVILILSFAYLTFRKPALYIYEKIINALEKHRETKKKKVKKDIETTKVNIEETKKEIKKEGTHFLTFDIFTEKLFDEEEITITPYVKEELNDEVKEKISPINEEKEEKIITESVPEETNDELIDETITNDEEPDLVSEQERVINEASNLNPSYYNDEVFEYEEDEDDNTTIETSNDDYEDVVKEEKIVEEPHIIKEEIINNNDTTNNKISEPYFAKEETSSDDSKEETLVSDLYSLLEDNVTNNATDELKEEVENNCIKINQKLEELNIKAKVSNYIIGPCVTRYEIVPEIGVRVSSIVNIQNDLKLALAAVNLRMEAPIPGKSAVGVEVANKKRYPVYLKEVLESKKDSDDKLLVAIGKDLNNTPVTISIDKMPHLLIAGATGSGKSVCINGIIMSLIIRATPDEVKMILVDPKKVEMLPYANMPHLLCPVVTDPKKASNALKKVVVEMDKRYDMFASKGVRNIESYNNLSGIEKMCKIVVIIDELADLMLVASKEVEESIQRITQLARAAGIYLIVATQRPSVDVITGVIKANIPSRIAFSVSSMVDSRTILDRSGAEDLLGKGDMLMDISGTNSLNRVQGVFVKDEEIVSVVNQIRLRYAVDFNEDFLNLEEEKKDMLNNLVESGDNNGEDELYYEIRTFVIQNQKASTSLLQRYFSLGYARAARMMDRLERDGVVSSSNGIKPREILVKEDDIIDEDNESQD